MISRQFKQAWQYTVKIYPGAWLLLYQACSNPGSGPSVQVGWQRLHAGETSLCCRYRSSAASGQSGQSSLWGQWLYMGWEETQYYSNKLQHLILLYNCTHMYVGSYIRKEALSKTAGYSILLMSLKCWERYRCLKQTCNTWHSWGISTQESRNIGTARSYSQADLW